MKKATKSGTPGGNRLRALREDCGRTQFQVELDASLGIGYLQRVESGKVRYPERDTLERILGALGAPYTERRDILEVFGYVVDTPLPDADEIRQAVAACQAELAGAVFPAYLLDCAHRLLSWNALVPKLFRIETEQVSMLRLLFDPACGFTPLIGNAEVFFPAQIRALRYEMRPLRGEDWYAKLIEALRTDYPLFKRAWDESSDSASVAARPLVALVIDLPGAGALRFRLTSEPLAQDRRFRVIYYLPADAVTLQQCAAWVAGR